MKIKQEIKGDDIKKVATISAQNEKIGELIAEAIKKVGKDGVITVEDGRGLEMDIDYKEGMEFDKGYASPYFVTNTDKMEAEIADPYILLTDKKVSNIQELLPFLENLIKVTKNFVIVADDIDGEALAMLVVNKLKGVFNVLCVKAPGFGDRRKEMLEDIATLTGATVISDDTGRKFDSVTVEDCGKADKVWSDKENTRIIGGKGDRVKIQTRVSQIKGAIDQSTSDFDREKLQERLAKLSGGVAVVNVGAATEIEMKEKKERVIDAVAATKAALEEGVVIGGGMALYRARASLLASKMEIHNSDKEKSSVIEIASTQGALILFNALQAPLLGILTRSGGIDIAGTLMELRDSKNSNDGYNVMTNKVEDLIKNGVIDPVKVTRLALLNAASVATMILTTEALVADIPEEKKLPAMPDGGMGGMGGMY